MEKSTSFVYFKWYTLASYTYMLIGGGLFTSITNLILARHTPPISHQCNIKKKGYYPTRIQQTPTHWKMVTYQHKILDSLLEMHLPESPGLALGMKARTQKEHTIQF